MKRGMGFLGLFSIASGAMISSGIFVLPGVVFGQIGPGLWISYLIAGAVATLGVLAVVELTTAMPRDILVVAGLVFVSFGGLVNITSVAEEAKRPASMGRVIP